MIEQIRKNNSQLPHDVLPAEGLSVVGRELREAREALGITIAEMANALRIRSVHIEALEAGRFDDLPGRPYILGFARSIAGHLGLEPDVIAMRLRDEVMGTAAPVELIFPESTEDKRLSRAGWIAISLALVAVAYGAWLALSPRRDVGPPEFAAVNSRPNSPPAPIASESEPSPENADAVEDKTPETTVVEAPAAPASAAAPAPAAAAKPPAPIAAKTDPAPAPNPVSTAVGVPAAPAKPTPPAVASTPPSPPRVAASSAPPPSAAIATAPSSDENAQDEEDMTPEPSTLAAAPAAPVGHVTLHANQDSWVQIQSSDGVTVMARTLRAGDSYTVPDRPGLRLTTGNAGALEILVDGQIAPPIGQIGAVRRNVALDPARLKAGTALE